MGIVERIRFYVNRIGERLWVKPLIFCILSILAVVLAKFLGGTPLEQVIPRVTADSLEALLGIMASSMLVIATFAVASMVSAYASASSRATPRSFRLVVADDASQNALSTFVGAFIFSTIALTAVKNEVFRDTGRGVLFSLTVIVFALVVFTFVRWVDQIARLGLLGTSIQKVEEATAAAIKQRRKAPTLGGIPMQQRRAEGSAVYASSVGYIQRVDVSALQEYAEEARGWVKVAALPGTFAMQGRPLAYVGHDDDHTNGFDHTDGFDHDDIAKAFVIGSERLFDEDPRYGFIVLSEIADKALSPGINDPGTAIAIIGSLTRLFVLWAEPPNETTEPEYDRVEVPELSYRDMFDDAFTAIARDGAGAIEVVVRLQKALAALSSLGEPQMRDAAMTHARLALARAENTLDLEEDVKRAREVAAFARVD